MLHFEWKVRSSSGHSHDFWPSFYSTSVLVLYFCIFPIIFWLTWSLSLLKFWCLLVTKKTPDNNFRHLSGFEVEFRSVVPKVLRSNAGWGAQEFHQQKLSSLSIACDIKLEGALYSVFYAEASKRPWASRNEWGMCQTPSLRISSLRLPLVI